MVASCLTTIPSEAQSSPGIGLQLCPLFRAHRWEVITPWTEAFLPLEGGYSDPQSPALGLAFLILHACLLLICCVTLYKSLPLSVPHQ